MELTVIGRIAARDQGPVHGLTVEVWDGEACEPRCLGHDLANADGSYRVTFCPPEDGCPIGVFLRIRDREGRLIHDGSAESCRCRPDAPATIDVVLAPETLWWHRASPLTWEPSRPGLLDSRALAEIDEAIDAFWPRSQGRRPSLCVTPPLAGFDSLVVDAARTVGGDLDAGRRFQNALDAVCATTSDSCCRVGTGEGGRLGPAVAALFDEPCPPELDCGDDAHPEAARRSPCRRDCGCGCDDTDHEPGCPCTAATSPVPVGDTLLLFLAVLQISCGDRATAIRYGTVLIDQICQLSFVDSLHRASIEALCGDERARAHLVDLLEVLHGLCCEGGEHASCHRSTTCCGGCLPADLERCLHGAICAWRDVACFRVTAITPTRACPGESIVVCGENLGDVPGRIVFDRYGTLDPGPVGRTTEWCCDSFTVIVPEGAGCGMSVSLPIDTRRVCDRFVDLRPFGCIEAPFEGTAPAILRFAVADRSDGDCVEPGTPLRIAWKTCAADVVRVLVRNADTGAVIDALDPAPERGTWEFDGSGFTTTTRVEVVVRAEGTCDPSVVERRLSLVYQARPDLTVDGIEVTQAIQHYKADQHLTDPTDRGADNSLQLVTRKTAWVRAYLRSGQVPTFDGGLLPDVDGTLTVERRVGGVWNTVAVIGSQNGPVDARDSFVSYQTERANIANTLNFVIPAATMTGLLRLTVDVQSPHPCPGNRASGSSVVDVNLQQTLNAAFFTIGYNGPDNAGTGTLNLPAPTLAACQAETSWAMTTYPVSGQPNVRVAGTFVTTTPLNDPRSCPGCCSPNWGPLLAQLAVLVALDQITNPGGWAYYGIIASGIPVTVPGCNGVATGGLAGQPMTYAHEIGHQFGLPHARCGNAGAGNAAYPVYEPYDLPIDVPANPINTTIWTMASIGEYGLDINNGAIADPNIAEDFMSYCGPRWVSKYTHDYLVDDPRLTPVVVPTGSGAATQRVVADRQPPLGQRPGAGGTEPLVLITGLVGADGTVDVHDVLRLRTCYHVGTGRPSRYRARLVGPDGEVVASDVVYQYSIHGACGDAERPCCQDCAEPEDVMIKAMIPDLDPGSAIQLVDGDEVVWERSCPDGDPNVSRVRASVTKDGTVRIRWSARCHGETERAMIRWSNDDGETWHALTAGVTGRVFDLPLDQAPSGAVRFEVSVSDGYSTVSAVTAAVDIPERPPSVTIFHPGPDDAVYAERQVHLWGTAAAGDGRSVDPEALVWDVDGTEVGRGPDLWVDAPSVGDHEVTLRVDGPSGPAETGSSFTVRPVD